MVVKRRKRDKQRSCRFESSVISYGSKTFPTKGRHLGQFESSVISYGSKT